MNEKEHFVIVYGIKNRSVKLVKEGDRGVIATIQKEKRIRKDDFDGMLI